MKTLLPLLLQVALLVFWHNADAQGIRIGSGLHAGASTLDIKVLGFDKQSYERDDLNLIILAEVDITRRLTVGLAARTRNSQYYTRQIDPYGKEVGWGNRPFSYKPYYQTEFRSKEGFEIPITIRYRLTESSLIPYITAEYSTGFPGSEGWAASYRVEWTQPITEKQHAIAETTIKSMALGIGVESRINTWFSLLAEIGWQHTFTSCIDADFMRVSKPDVLVGKIILLFEVLHLGRR